MMEAYQLNFNKIASKMEVFAHSHGSIAAAYLFGSAARQKMRSYSDLDIAILSTCDIKGMNRINMETELSNLMQRDVDLVIFHHADTLLQNQILKYGCLIYESNPAERVRQETAYRRVYLDTCHLYKKLFDNNNSILR